MSEQWYVTRDVNGVTYAIEHIWPDGEIEWGPLSIYNAVARFDTFEEACSMVGDGLNVQVKEYPVEGIELP